MSKKACLNVTRGSVAANKDLRTSLWRMFLVLFIAGFIALDAGIAFIIASYYVDFSAYPWLLFIGNYVMWVLLVIGIAFMALSFWFLSKRRSICESYSVKRTRS